MISKQRFFVAVAVAIGVAAGTALAARPEVVELNLTPSSAQLAACMPNARVDVTVRLTTDLRGFDVFHVHAVGLPPNTTFTAFLLEQARAPFGAAEYIGDFTSDDKGRADNTFRMIVAEAFASTLVNGQREGVELIARKSGARTSGGTRSADAHVGLCQDVGQGLTAEAVARLSGSRGSSR